jgi:predicted ATP-dependent Lon-type protease
MQVEATWFQDFSFWVVVGKPDTRCKRALQITLTLGYPENAGLVILGDLSIQRNIKPMRLLDEPRQVAMDNGARKALIPSKKEKFSRSLR